MTMSVPPAVALTALFAFDAIRARGHPRHVTGTRTPWWTLPAVLLALMAPLTPLPMALMAPAAPAGMRILVWTAALIRHRRAWRPDMRERERHARLHATEHAYGIERLRTFDGRDPFRSRRDGAVQVRWAYRGRLAQGVLTIHAGRARLYDREGRALEPVRPATRHGTPAGGGRTARTPARRQGGTP